MTTERFFGFPVTFRVRVSAPSIVVSREYTHKYSRVHRCARNIASAPDIQDDDDRAADDELVVGRDHDEVVIVGTRAGWVTARVSANGEEDYRRWLQLEGGSSRRILPDRLT